ncbi:hypothetical protein GCM10010441_39280 [Kitasatospora paracochleata]|uniref:SAF domain-containing protein n=1 Tax=Kitasatospora paracochleata TaxID=58354 RepID=A0ABT1J931_9ACTN|nr:hypothetical protein [Kitasatospora paracochleata]MCP2313955.1 hypothetical protein [Kitasatospora paracochleata]
MVRERRYGLAVMAALLVIAGGLGATVLQQKAGQRVSAVKVTQRVAPGQHIPSAAIEEIKVAEDTPVNFVRWEQRGLLTSRYFTASEVPAGTLLTGMMLTEKVGVATDQSVVGLSLKSGTFPAGLREGDRVRVMWVGRTATQTAPTGGASGGTPAGTELAASATIRQVFKNDNGSSSSLSLNILVPAEKAGAVAQASANGEVALVLLPAAAQ